MRRKCIIPKCKYAGDDGLCGSSCPYFVAMYGASGEGGRLGAVGLPREYQHFTVADNPIRDSQANAYKYIDKVAQSYRRMFDDAAYLDPKDRIKNVYLWSRAPGTGKTATASALAHEWVKTHFIGSLKRRQQPKEFTAYFLDIVEFQMQYNAHNRSNARGDEAEKAFRKYMRMFDNAKDADLVIMDDIGARGASEAFRTDLHAIINYRYSKQKPTIYTSNIPMDELTDIFDAKLYDRVRDLTVEIEFEGQSKRGRR